ncbi:MAG TPA: SapC family protein [Rhodocyclaceae bacterium]
MTTGNDGAPAPAKDIFRQPRPLDRGIHKALVIDRQAGFGFARRQIAVPIALGEFAAAARDYPIVFAGDPVQPFALLGLREGANLLVGDDGVWRRERYVPAHLRRYPFVLMETPDKNLILCIDEAAEHFTAEAKKDPLPLFVDGQPAPLVNEALAFLSAFQNEIAATREFAAAVKGLLVDRRAQIDLKGPTGPISLTGFEVVDEQKFAGVDDATFLDWRKRGWLAPIHFHLQSLANFGLLSEWATAAPAAA